MHDIIQVCVQRPRGGVVVEHQAVSKPGGTILNLVGTNTCRAINSPMFSFIILGIPGKFPNIFWTCAGQKLQGINHVKRPVNMLNIQGHVGTLVEAFTGFNMKGGLVQSFGKNSFRSEY